MRDNDDNFGSEERSRLQVIQDIKKSHVSHTYHFGEGSESWSKGSRAEIVKQSDGEEFIRSERNPTDRII
jgi:hypothetical protein